MNILILGVNGFIGSALAARLLETTDWEIYGMDLTTCKLGTSIDDPRLHFLEGDITINQEWIEYHVKKCDIVLPLVAIATPALYVKDPLRVFELDFEANLRIVRQCARYGTRLVFPSTSEVYGMNGSDQLDENESQLVYGPINKTRWIYACSKQLLDRVIAAYGQTHGLRYTCIRPFNWIGPKLDGIGAAKEGSSRVVTQFMANLLGGKAIRLVDGGAQKRCFTWLGDGIDALMCVLENEDARCDGEILNIGNPEGECSVKQLAERLISIYESWRITHPGFPAPKVESVAAEAYYGGGYQDILQRRPAIDKARHLLGWAPRTSLDDALRMTFEAFVDEWSFTASVATRPEISRCLESAPHHAAGRP